jgi:hypothetical protein
VSLVGDFWIDADGPHPRAGVVHRQALLACGTRRLVTWLPAKGLTRGSRVGPATVVDVYEIKMRKCATCGRLHTLDVTGCA